MSCFWVNAPSYSCSSCPLKFRNQWTYNLIPHHAQQIKPCPFRISRSLLQQRESLRTLPPTPAGCHSIWFSLAWFTLVLCANLWLTHFVHSPLKLSRCPLQRSHSLKGGVESGVTSEACLANGYRAMANMMCKKSCQTIHFPRFWINPSVCCLLSFHLRETQTDLAPNCLSCEDCGKIGASTLLFKNLCNTMLIFDPPTFLLIRFFFC